MVIAWQRNAARWRESQKTEDNCEGRDSVPGFVSGGTSVRLAHPGQGQITTKHQTLGTIQEVANLRAKFAIGRPACAHGVHAKQCPGNVAVARASQRGIKRLQGAQMQQRRTTRWPRHRSGNFAMKHEGLSLILGQTRAR